MARQAVRPGDRVLDTCGGLGYTAIAALELGAREVITVEYSPTVIDLREMNPWSQKLQNRKITAVNADSGEYIKELKDNYFDSIIHDPPRFSLASHLYSEDFYRQLFRVLKRRGRLFHYTGNPYVTRKGNSFVMSAGKRLEYAGFRSVNRNEKLMGLLASR